MPAATKQPHRFHSQAHQQGAGNTGIRWLVVAAAALVLGCQLFTPPIVGLADNGDFPKLIGRYGLMSPAYWEYVGVRYPYNASLHYDPGFSSSEQIFVRAAIRISRLTGGDRSLDIRAAGLVHGLFFLLAVGLFVPLLARMSRGAQLAYCAAALLVFTDVMYVSYFNSLYMDVSALLMLLLSVVFYLRAIAWRRRTDALLFVASSVILISSKPQHAVLGIWIAALAWEARGPLWGGGKFAAVTAAAVLVLTGWVTYRFAAPPGYSANNCFNVVFYQILPHTRDVDRTLADLGLDSGDRMWIGKTAYSPDSKMENPAFSQAFSRKVSYAKLARFYATHPRDAWRALRSGVAQAGRERERIGNFPANAGRAPSAESTSFALWSDLKRKAFYAPAWRLLLSFLLVAGLVIFLVAKRSRPNSGATAGAVVLAGTALTEMLIASFGDALDMARHHLIFHAEFDMLILVALWLGMERWALQRSEGAARLREAISRRSGPSALA